MKMHDLLAPHEADSFPTFPFPVNLTSLSFHSSHYKYLGVGTIPWSPLACGKLARPTTSEETKRSKTDECIRVMVKGAEETSAQIINRYVLVILFSQQSAR